MDEEKQEKLWPSYRKMIRRLATAPKLTASAAAFLLAGIAMALARPWILGSAVDALESADAASGEIARVGLRYAALFFGVTALMNLFRFGYNAARGAMVQGLVADLREEALEKLHVLSPVFYGKHDSGQIIARVSRDIQKMQPFFGIVIFTLIQLSLMVVGTFVLIAARSALLAAVTAVCFLLSASLLYWTARGLQPLNRKADDVYDGVALDIKENIEGVKIVKSFGREGAQRTRFVGKLDHYVNSTIDVTDFWSLRMPLAHTLFGLSVPLILLLGGKLVIAGTLAKGAVVACLFYAGRIFHELHSLTRLVAISQEAGVSAQRLFELIDSPHTVPQDSSPSVLPPGRGALEFAAVAFGYPGSERVLNELSFAVRPGECVALVGPTGCGKSTLISLLLRFFDPQSGSIRLDGTDIRRLPLKDLRRAIGCVFQETFLFSATLRENLAFAMDEANDEKILAAAGTAQLAAFVEELSDGLETVVGERGVTLSGGQKQRVAIARALLADPRILVLDDAMASVDAQTERGLVEALHDAATGRTTLIVTQRLSGVLLADRVIVVEAGRVIDSGTHEDLFARCAVYRELFAGQVLDAAPAAVEQGHGG
ncbi:MAG: ABC transporter ATP-binding protein [Elusimicrobiota bacterium]